MKFIVIIFATIVTSANFACGQGQVNFGSTLNSATRIGTNAVVGGPSTGVTASGIGNNGMVLTPWAYFYALFVAPSYFTIAPTLRNPIADGFTLVSPPYGTNTVPGRFSGNPASGVTEVPGHPIGSAASFVVVGWSANLGRTWPELQASLRNHTTLDGNPYGFIGESHVAVAITLGGDAIPPGAIFGTALPNQIQGFTLQFTYVPEPNPLALCVFGALLLAIRHWRKAIRIKIAPTQS